MNLTLHHFRKDLRQFRVILLVWLFMLGLDLATNLGWVDGPGTGWRRGLGGPSLGNFMAGLQIFFLWVLFFLIPSAVVLADSPGRREGFLRTRPLSGSELFFAKALFVVALVILPAAIQEAVYLLASGLPAGYVLHGVGDRLLFSLPLAAIAAAFASLWRSYSQWVRGLAILFGGVVGFWLLLVLILYLTGHLNTGPGESSAPQGSRNVAAFYGFGLATIGLAVVHARYSWGPVRRWLGIAATIVILFLVSIYWPWDLFKQNPPDLAAAQAVVRQSPFNVSLQQIQVNPMFGKQWTDRLDFGVTVTPQLNRAVFPNQIEWSARDVQLATASGQSFPPAKPPEYIPNLRLYGRDLQADEVRIWAGFLPPDVLFRLNRMALPGGDPTPLGEFMVDNHAAWLGDPVTLKARVKGRVYRWAKVADFALSTPASVKDEGGTWTYLAKSENDLLLKRSQVGFLTATEERLTGFESSPYDRYEFILYNPQGKVAWRAGNSAYGSWTVRARSTALSQHWLELTIAINAYGASNWKPVPREELAQCRLLIFEKTWLGNVPVDWQSPGWVINDLMALRSTGNNGNHQDGLTRSEVERRLAELALPGPDASRAEVCRYLLQAVPIMDDSRDNQPPGETVVTQLATLVPGHLDVLLEGLPAMSGPSKKAVTQAIIRGAGESQKQPILAALSGNPGLMEVVFQRGWLAAARDPLYKIMDSPKPLPFETLQAIASFADPATYPRLLTEFEAHPSTEVYDLLRPLPGMADPLAASVTRMWENHDCFVSYHLEGFLSVLNLALHAGNPDALRYAGRLLAEINPAKNSGPESWEMALVFRRNVKLDGLKPGDYNNDQRLLDWMRHHPADAFVFDPVRQRFVLKP